MLIHGKTRGELEVFVEESFMLLYQNKKIHLYSGEACSQ